MSAVVALTRVVPREPALTAKAFLGVMVERGTVRIIGSDRNHKACAMTLLIARVVTIWSKRKQQYLNVGHVLGSFDDADEWTVRYLKEIPDGSAVQLSPGGIAGAVPDQGLE